MQQQEKPASSDWHPDDRAAPASWPIAARPGAGQEEGAHSRPFDRAFLREIAEHCRAIPERPSHWGPPPTFFDPAFDRPPAPAAAAAAGPRSAEEL